MHKSDERSALNRGQARSHMGYAFQMWELACLRCTQLGLAGNPDHA